MKFAICLHYKDNVATLLDEVCLGDLVIVKDSKGEDLVVLQVEESMPHGYKIALQEIEAKAYLVKYGEIIGRANRLIRKGSMVHIHNLDSLRGGFRDV